MQREEDKDRVEKTPFIHDIVRDIIRHNVSPYGSKDSGIRNVMRDLYHLDVKTLRFLRQTHTDIVEQGQ